YFDVALISIPDWPGYSTGLQISVLDIIAVVVVIFVRRWYASFPVIKLIWVYAIVVAMSLLQSEVLTPSIFYLWQVLKIIILMIAVVRLCENYNNCMYIYLGMASGISIELAIVLYQRFMLGYFQTPGTLDHQNMLGMTLHFYVYPI